MAVTVATIPPSYHDGDVPPVDEDRRIEEELRRRERAAPPPRGEKRDSSPAAPPALHGGVSGADPAPGEAASRTAPAPADPPLNRRDLRLLLAETEGRLAAGIAAVAERALPASEVLKEIRDRAARESRLADNVADLQESLRPRAGWRSFLRRLALALAVAAAVAAAAYAGALLQRDRGVLPDPSDGWRDYLWYRYGPELRDCIAAARRAGKNARCEIVWP